MKLINSKYGKTIEVKAAGSIAGRRCDSIELNQDDLTDLLKLSPMALHDRISEIRGRVNQVEQIGKRVTGRSAWDGACTPRADYFIK